MLSTMQPPKTNKHMPDRKLTNTASHNKGVFAPTEVHSNHNNDFIITMNFMHAGIC